MPAPEAPEIQPLDRILARIASASQAVGREPARLLAVGKGQPAEAIARLHAAGQIRFGENYVQEALAKQEQLAQLRIEWHLIGPLQSNKAGQAASRFDWVQSLDRPKLVPLLAAARPATAAALNVLLQVNIDAEASKSGCRPEEVDHLASLVLDQPRLRLRGLMAIPSPAGGPEARITAFRAMRGLYEGLARRIDSIDTLSMGMSDDFELAIAEGANLVRIGTALFGARPPVRTL